MIPWYALVLILVVFVLALCVAGAAAWLSYHLGLANGFRMSKGEAPALPAPITRPVVHDEPAMSPSEPDRNLADARAALDRLPQEVDDEDDD